MKKQIKTTVIALMCCVFLAVFASCGASGNMVWRENYNGMAVGKSQLDSMRADGSSYQYNDVIENDFVETSVEPKSSFSLDKNTASYSLMRNQIKNGYKPEATSIRLEEYINYFSYPTYEAPTDDALKLNYKMIDCPWNSANKLLSVGLKARDIEIEEVKNNLVFLLDTSGSMFGSDRLGLIQEAFLLLTENLNDTDCVSIVTYAGSTRVALDGAHGYEKLKINAVIGDLTASGSTNGSGAIELAYNAAKKHFIEGGNNRVILATDGDFNVGLSTEASLKSFISEKRNEGIYFSVLGVGMGNTRDDFMSTLAQNGNGNYNYLDSVDEARKVLVQEINGTLVTVAKDAKAQVEFTNEVEKYRLIGYETKLMSVEEFEDTEKDAGEIGAGHVVTAIYEIKLAPEADGEVATFRVKYKDVEQDNADKDLSLPVALGATSDEDIVFISCVAEYALILRESDYKADASFNAVIARLESLESVTGENANEFRAEFLGLVKQAKLIYSK